MKIIELSEKETTCEYCGTRLGVTAKDIEYEIEIYYVSGEDYERYKPYYVCPACKAKNYDVPKGFGNASRKEIQKLLRSKYEF